MLQLAFRGIAVLCGIVVFGSCARAAASEPRRVAAKSVSTEDFFRPPAFDLPKVNRAGNKIVAQMQMDDDHVGGIVFDLKGGKKRAFQLAGDHDVFEIHWLDDTYILTSQSQEKLFATGLFVIDARDVRDQYPIESDSMVEVVAVPEDSPMRPLVWIRQDAYQEGRDIGVVTLNAKQPLIWENRRDLEPHRRRETTVERNGTAASISVSYPTVPGTAETYMADRDGKLAFALAVDGGVEHLYYLERKKWQRSALDMDKFDLVGAGDAPEELIAVGPRGENKPRPLVRVDAKTARITGTLYTDEQYDPQPRRLIRHPKTHQLIGFQLYRQTLETVWLDAAHQAIQQTVAHQFPDDAVSYLGSDADEKRFVFAVFSDRHPVAYYSFDVAKNEVAMIADTAPWLSNVVFAPMQKLAYKTRDGFEVEGYFTAPEGASKEAPPPLVVLVHGGPWSRDYFMFDPEVQFLVSRGYAVFQPNYRGSLGYSWRFPAGDDWDFMKMHNDVTDGVQKLITSGLVDPHRIAIMGASFGGYLALCGATFEPGLYRCAISYAGVFDWNLMMKQARRDQFESARYQIFSRNIGDPQKNPEWFAQVSPINHIDQIKIPVLVAHGRMDEVVDVEQSKHLVDELEEHHVPHQTFFSSGEGHGLSRFKNRVAYYTAVEQFLAENMQPILGSN